MFLTAICFPCPVISVMKARLAHLSLTSRGSMFETIAFAVSCACFSVIIVVYLLKYRVHKVVQHESEVFRPVALSASLAPSN